MNRLRYISLIFSSLIISFSSPGQSHPYAKFDSGGQIIGLFNLSEKRSDCRDRQSTTGSTRSLKFDEHDEDMIVSFVFDTGNARRFVGFTIGRKAIPRADVESLLSSRNKPRVTACLTGGRWIAEEITK